MNYADQIPVDIISLLLDMLETKMEGYDDVSKLFLIQYTYFKLKNGSWKMKTFLDICHETIKDIYLNINEENTRIYVYSSNAKIDILRIKKKLDMRKQSKPGKIYACDLYQDFCPEHYVGKCYTAIIN